MHIGIPWVYGRCARVIIKYQTKQLKALVLTFDDGPGDRLTKLILQTLSEYNAKATFFVLGRNVKGREDVLIEMISAGHEVGFHGYDHLHYWKVPPWRALLDIKKGWEVVDIALGRKGRIIPFRPPGGKLNMICLLFLLLKRIPIVYWSDVSGDTKPARHFEQNTVALRMPRNNTGIVLAHDFDRSSKEFDQVLIKWLSSLLNATKKESVHVFTFSKLMSELL